MISILFSQRCFFCQSYLDCLELRNAANIYNIESKHLKGCLEPSVGHVFASRSGEAVQDPLLDTFFLFDFADRKIILAGGKID